MTTFFFLFFFFCFVFSFCFFFFFFFLFFVFCFFCFLLSLFFMRGEWEKESNTTICGSSSAHQRNANQWRFAGGSMMAQH